MTAVHQAEARRCAAIMAGDFDEVERLLDPDLRYVHSTGRQDDAATLLELLRSGVTQYRALAHDITVRHEVQNVAVAEGTMSMRLGAVDGEKNIETRTLMIWRCSNDEWKLLDFQATAVPVHV